VAFATGTGAGVFAWSDLGWVNLSGTLATGIPGVELTELADMNGDGLADAVLLSEDETRVYLSGGDGTWALAATLPTDSACGVEALRAGVDIDHNGRADLAYVTEEDCSIFVGGTNKLHLWREGSTPETADLIPASPRGGEVWVAGSVRMVDWSSALPAGAGHPEVSIELSLNGADGPFTDLAGPVPDAGRYQWRLPADLPSSTTARMRWTLHTEPPVSVVSPGDFTIVGPTASSAPLASMGTGSLMAAPNPCNPRTTLHLETASSGRVVVAIHDLRGHLVRRLDLGEREAGFARVDWVGDDDTGHEAASGTYLARLMVDGAPVAGDRIILVR
jgi:hypothetical protein